jgi:O-antigen/teichoic acid export membrane protein
VIPNALWRVARLGGTLAFATLVGQVVYLFFLPLIARRFAAAEIGDYSFLLAICVIVGGLGGLRLDLVIGVSRSSRSICGALAAGTIASLTSGLLATVTAIVLVPEALPGYRLGLILAATASQALLPLGIAAALNVGANGFAALLAFGRNGVVAPIQLALVGKVSAVDALIAGNAITLLLVVGVVMFVSRRSAWTASFGARHIWPVLRTHRDRVTYATLQSTVGLAGQNLPQIMVRVMLGAESAGIFWMALRIVQAPTVLIAESIRQPLLQHYRKQPRLARRSDWYQSTVVLACFGLVGLVAAFIFGQSLVTRLLGAEWAPALPLVQYLIFWAVLLFTNVPSTTLLIVEDRQRQLFGMEASVAVVRVVVMFAALLSGSLISGTATFAAVGVVGNLLIVAAVWKAHISDRGRP